MFNLWHNLQEEFEDTRGVIRIRISEKEQTTQWPKEKAQKYKQRSSKHTHKTKDRATRTPPKTRGGGECRCSRRVSSSTRVKCNMFSPLVGIYSNDNEIKLTDCFVLFNMLYVVGFTQWHSLSNHLIRYCFVINSISGSYCTVVVTLK